LWSQFTAAGHEPSHILIRPDSEAGQQLSNALHDLVLKRTHELDMQCGDFATSIRIESNTLRGLKDVVAVLRLNPAAAALVADALSVLNPDTDVAKRFVQEVGSRLIERHLECRLLKHSR
jgi:hypothetical protein